MVGAMTHAEDLRFQVAVIILEARTRLQTALDKLQELGDEL